MQRAISILTKSAWGQAITSRKDTSVHVMASTCTHMRTHFRAVFVWD